MQGRELSLGGTGRPDRCRGDSQSRDPGPRRDGVPGTPWGRAGRGELLSHSAQSPLLNLNCVSGVRMSQWGSRKEANPMLRRGRTGPAGAEVGKGRQEGQLGMAGTPESRAGLWAGVKLTLSARE